MTYQDPSTSESVLAITTMKALRKHLEAEESKMAFAVVTSRKDFEAHLQPGDILVTTNAPAHATGTFGAVLNNTLRTGIRAVYGDAGHAAAYVGDGKTVEMAEKLHHYNLAHSLKGKDVTVLRPTGLTDEQRAAAAEFLKKTVSMEQAVSQYAKPGVLARSLVEDFTGKKRYADKDKEIAEQKRYTCSNLVAHAYKQTAGIDVRDHKSVGSVSPLDFLESSKMQRVVTFHNPNRHDKNLRKDPALGGVLARFRKKVSSIQTDSHKDLLKVLKPGDIIITSRIENTQDKDKDPLKWFGEEVFKGINQAMYGEDAHAAIYTGKGKAVDMRADLRSVSLATALERRDARFVRPDVPPQVREAAAQRAVALQKALGTNAQYADNSWMLKLVANELSNKKLFQKAENDQVEKNKYICSNLVAKTYAGDVKFVEGRDVGFVTPKDLSRSPKVKEVAVYANPERWDKHRRKVSGLLAAVQERHERT